jgi:hypothetical protein
MKMVMKVVAFFSSWVIAAVIAWGAYSMGYTNGDTNGRINERQYVEWIEAMEKAHAKATPAPTPAPVPAPFGSVKIYRPDLSVVAGSVVPDGDHWNIHTTEWDYSKEGTHVKDSIMMEGYLVRNGSRYDILNYTASVCVGHVIQGIIYSDMTAIVGEVTYGGPDGRVGHIDQNGDWQLEVDGGISFWMTLEDDWLKREMTPVF